MARSWTIAPVLMAALAAFSSCATKPEAPEAAPIAASDSESLAALAKGWERLWADDFSGAKADFLAASRTPALAHRALRGLAVGASDFISKPVDETELALRAKNLLRVVEFEEFLQRHNEELDAQVRERTAQLEGALEQLRRSKDELKASYLDTIFRLTTVAEYKDGFTAGHIKRVGHYCRHLAREIGWGEEEQEAIFYASPMHDIGKVVIPSEILGKPGPLTAEEFTIAKGHTTAGAHILQGSSSAFLQMAEVIALTHHERHDGGGYPRGLRGDEVPLAGMIMNIADQYEALRSVRPYKPPLTHERVIEILTRGDGRTMPGHFHPRVLEAFGDSTERFAAIFAEFEAEG